MKKCIIAVVTILLLASSVHALFSWSTYQGTSEWDVQVSDDEGGCGGSVHTKIVEMTITHTMMIATMGDYEHGPLKGSFVGNVLTIPEKTVDDQGGKSTLYEHKVTFTPDCLGFTSEYDWRYVDKYQDCRGTTTLTGKKAGAQACPELPKSMREMIDDARAAEANQREQKFLDILANDPTNFWANWDMAALKKQQGDYKAYLDYTARAAGNSKIDEATATTLKDTAAKSVHLSSFPTADKSPILRIEGDELKNWNSGMLYNVRYTKETAPKFDVLKWIFRDMHVPSLHNAVDDLVQPPG
jgi:hypothetical protein